LIVIKKTLCTAMPHAAELATVTNHWRISTTLQRLAQRVASHQAACRPNPDAPLNLPAPNAARANGSPTAVQKASHNSSASPTVPARRDAGAGHYGQGNPALRGRTMAWPARGELGFGRIRQWPEIAVLSLGAITARRRSTTRIINLALVGGNARTNRIAGNRD